jgi:hypothetical protein
VRIQTRRFDLRRFTRQTLTTAAIAAVVGGSAFLTSGTASAATLLAGNCGGAETGSMGDQVVISGQAMHKLVAAGVNESGSFLANGDWSANDLDKVTAIPLGKVPNGPSGTISGAAIGDAVSQALANVHSWWLGWDPNRAIANVRNKVAGNCGLNVFASNYVAPNAGNQAHGGQPGMLPKLPGSVAFPGASTGYAAPRDYNNIPAATPGIAVPPGARYPTSAVPGQSPEFGLLGQAQDGTTGQADVRDAGQADALGPDTNATEAVQLPMLLAVVALAGVTAALVRTWVLRRT